MATTTNKVKFWRGTRAQYNALGADVDYNTYYTVREENGHWSMFYGPMAILVPSGQLPPVSKVVEFADITEDIKSSIVAGKKGILVHDATNQIGLNVPDDFTGYYTLEKRIDGKLEAKLLDEGVSVRIGEKKYKTYQVVDGVLKTYDDVDAGRFDG